MDAMPLSLYVLIFIGCSVVILFASKLVYRQLHALAEALSVPPFFIATLLLALSTSTPELFIGVTSALGGVPSFALGNIIGANILGLTLIAGLVILLGRARVELSNHIERAQLVLTFGIACVPVLMLLAGSISRVDGLILLALYALYVVYSLYVHQWHHDATRKARVGLSRALVLFGTGVALLVVASQVLFIAARSVSEALNIAPFVIGIFALSFGTTLPEIAFGIRSAFDRKPELSLGDIVGASAVNACGILGLVALITPIVPDDLGVALADGAFYMLLVLLFYFILWKREATRTRGALLLLLYVVFIVFNILFNQAVQ